MPPTISIQKAAKNDFDAVCALLSANNLPIIDLNPLLEDFLLAFDENEITAVMGMDRYGDAGLLRSAAVKASHRNLGIAAALINRLLDDARSNNLKVLYLITNTAEQYFAKKGFEKIEREAVPPTVLQSKEFNGLCPASSVMMRKYLS